MVEGASLSALHQKEVESMSYVIGYEVILPILPNMMPFSVDATFTLALMLQKSCGANVIGWGFSTSFKSPAQRTYTMQHYTDNECLCVQWYKYFHDVKDEMFHSTS